MKQFNNLINKYLRLISEANLIDPTAIQLQVEPIVLRKLNDIELDETPKRNIINWFNKALLKWAQSDDARDPVLNKDSILAPYTATDKDPEWARNKTDLSTFKMTPELAEVINHTIDFITATDSEYMAGNTEGAATVKLAREPWQAVRQKVQAWDAAAAELQGADVRTLDMDKRALLESLKEGEDYVKKDWFGTPLAQPEDPKYMFVRLTSMKALKNEGAQLQHCVGKGSYRPDNVNSVIYSIRKIAKADRAGNTWSGPKATLEVNEKGRTIRQIKGLLNGRVTVPHHAKMIRGALKHWLKPAKGEPFQIEADGQNVDLWQWENKWYNPYTEEAKQVWFEKIRPAQKKIFADIQANSTPITKEELLANIIAAVQPKENIQIDVDGQKIDIKTHIINRIKEEFEPRLQAYIAHNERVKKEEDVYPWSDHIEEW